MPTPLIELTNLWREYPSGDDTIAALKGVNLTIEAGEIVAVVGQSGSGKSTLMNILGCLDRPTQGAYCVAGRNMSLLYPDELAQLRRERFGFVFQRYRLLEELSAVENVEIPAVYAGMSRLERRDRAEALLTRLGLTDRMNHYPSQLSGGQQQRVSIARALMNGGQVILADEPTGALDSHNGGEMMRLLEELNADGHTIIIVTHDFQVAEHAHRIIELKDGEVVGGRANPRISDRKVVSEAAPPKSARRSPAALADRLIEAARMAVLAVNAHRLRSFLTMLGIIIGIASIVSVVALGEGTEKAVLTNFSALGTNTIDVYPGQGPGDPRASGVHTLTPADADALAKQSYVDSVTPAAEMTVTIRYLNVSAEGVVNGVGEDYFRVHGITIIEGSGFDRRSVHERRQEVVIDDGTAAKLFGKGGSVVGAVILLGNVPCRVIGVAAKKKFGFEGNNLTVWVPYTTVLGRMVGHSYLSGITVRLTDTAPTDLATDAIVKLLRLRHGSTDYFTSASDTIRNEIQRSTGMFTILIGMIALISLLVGGIGVMNIMLVSVAERTQEIGVRTAVGARRSDILSQFLIESVLVCMVGGAAGTCLAVLVATLFDAFAGDAFVMDISPLALLLAFAFSCVIGVLFGFMPAHRAANLDPVVALTRE